MSFLEHPSAAAAVDPNGVQPPTKMVRLFTALQLFYLNNRFQNHKYNEFVAKN